LERTLAKAHSYSVIPETKVHWNLFNDLPGFTPSHSIEYLTTVEIAKHLRVVHFAIMAIGVLILLPKIGMRPSEVVKANNLLKSIVNIRTDWHLWSWRFAYDQQAWIKKLGVHWFKGDPEHGYIPSARLDAAKIKHSPNQGFQLRLKGAPLYFFVNTSSSSGSTERFIIAQPNGKLDASDTFPTEFTFPSDDSRLQRFTTLQVFRHFWDAHLSQWHLS